MSDLERVHAARRALAEALREETELTDYAPIRDRVIVTPIREDTDEKRGSLYVPDTAQKKKQRYMVVAVGPGILTKKGRVAPDVEPGDVVVAGDAQGMALPQEGLDVRMMRATDMLAKLREE